MKNKQLKAGIYLRISHESKGQKARSESEAIERQREDCQWMCEHYGYRIVKEYVDRDKSAFKTDIERPAYERLMADYRAGKVDVIVAYKLDRLTRSWTGFGATLTKMVDEALCICTTDTGFMDLSRSDARLMAQMFIAFAEFESARKSERMLRASKQRAKQGKRKKSIRAYGFNPDWSINEEQAEVVRAIYAAVAEGRSIESIRRSLAGSGEIGGFPTAPPPGGKVKMWYSSTIKGMLRNPDYAGYAVSVPDAKRKKILRKNREIREENERKRKEAEEKGIEIDESKLKDPVGFMHHWREFIQEDEHGVWRKSTEHEAIVDEALWLRVQDILDDPAREKNRCGNNRKNLGSNLYRCGVCGAPMRASAESYRCLGHVSRRKGPIDEYVSALVVARLSDKKSLRKLIRSASPDVSEILKEIKAHREEIAEFFGYLRAHKLTIDEYDVIRNEHEAAIEELEEKRRELTSVGVLEDVIGSEDPAQAFRDAPVKTQAAIVDALMTVTLHKHPPGRKTFDGSDVTIEWK